MTAAIRKVFAEKPAEFDPRKYLGPARENMKKLYEHKIINVLGSAGKLAQEQAYWYCFFYYPEQNEKAVQFFSFCSG